jgi:FtsH-binding integral membrane protein
MFSNDINPYESPKSVAVGGKAGSKSRFLRAIIRFLTMGLAGYASFTVFGLLYWAVSDYLDVSASIGWALAVGSIGAVLFLSSEIFNSGSGRTAGVLRRIHVAGAVFVPSGLLAGILSESLGWNQRTYFEEPWWLHNLLLSWAVYAIGLVTVRMLWIGSRKGTGLNV